MDKDKLENYIDMAKNEEWLFGFLPKISPVFAPVDPSLAVESIFNIDEDPHASLREVYNTNITMEYTLNTQTVKLKFPVRESVVGLQVLNMLMSISKSAQEYYEVHLAIAEPNYVRENISTKGVVTGHLPKYTPSVVINKEFKPFFIIMLPSFYSIGNDIMEDDKALIDQLEKSTKCVYYGITTEVVNTVINLALTKVPFIQFEISVGLPTYVFTYESQYSLKKNTLKK